MQIRPYLLAVMLSCASLPSYAGADDADLPTLDPIEHPRVMRQTDKGSTSTCIGRPATPICAVEQLIGSRVRGDVKLWTLAVGNTKQPDDYFSKRKANVAFAYYRVVGAQRLDDASIRRWFEAWGEMRCGELIEASRQGDIRIDVQIEYNHKGKKEHRIEGDSVPETYVVRKIGLRSWRIIDSCYPRIEDEKDMYWMR
jgi:hypothetical protein